jgi:Flp pilus assembly protein TadG
VISAPSILPGNLREDSGAQLVEFAVALPLLVVFVVGIFDFSGAFTIKQKLTNVARDAARVAAADPSNDVSSSTALPASVADAYQVVANYFTANQLNNCGVTAAGGTQSGTTWSFSGAGNGCSGSGLTIIINRGYYFPETSGSLPPSVSCQPPVVVGTQTAVIGTCVSIQYAYPWRFGNVDKLLGSSPLLPTALSATAIAMNEN